MRRHGLDIPFESLRTREGQADYFARLVYQSEIDDCRDRISLGLWAAEDCARWGRTMILAAEDNHDPNH